MSIINNMKNYGAILPKGVKSYRVVFPVIVLGTSDS